MKKKTINSIITKKINSWLNTLPDDIKDYVKDKIIVTGGSIVSLLTNEKVNDYDVYLSDKKSCLLLSEYYVKLYNDNGGKCDIKIEDREPESLTSGRISIKVQSSGIATSDDDVDFDENVESNNEDELNIINEELCVDNNKFSKNSFRPIYLTSNAITLSDKLQIVIRFYGEPENIHDNYDFVHCTNYWYSKDKQLVLKQEALECIMNKDLVFHSSRYPICSMIRLRKFLKRGWTISAGQLLKIAYAINDLDMNDVNVLEDQLTGVDSTYFKIFIEQLKMKKCDDGDIDRTYVSELIDTIF